MGNNKVWNMRRFETKILSRFPVLLAALALLAQCSEGAQWEYGTIDSSGVGRYSSLKFDRDGNAHVAYVIDGQNTLKYGFWDHKLKRWFIMVIDGRATHCALALDSKQRPHISYVDYGSAKEARLRYAYWNGSAWTKKFVPLADGAAFYTSIALDRNDKPHISFYDYLAPDNEFVLRLRITTWNDTYWEVRTADDQDGSGKFNSLAVDSAGNPQVAYANVKDPNQGLRYARWTGSAWKSEILDAPCYAWSVGIGSDKQGVPHIAYTDVQNKLVKYATLDGDKWRVQTIASLQKAGYPDRNGVAVDSRGNPYITYHDAGTGSLILLYRDRTNWRAETVDQSGTGFTSSIDIDGDSILISYADETNGSLKFARRTLAQSASGPK